MDYFSILNLDREPFSNTPDPQFLFESRQHVCCLQKIELALRLKRGLNVVIGSVGAGKTTLCRALLQQFASDTTIESHLILDPGFDSPSAFLRRIGRMITGRPLPEHDGHGAKEQIKNSLFQKGVKQNKTVILIVDEGQKLSLDCLEILRELLNYETNTQKLLQIVVFAQDEFQQALAATANLADRVNLIHFLGPMDFGDTCRMIRFRIGRASSDAQGPNLFTPLSLFAIYRATGGYPRKIIHLCHQCMLAMIIQNRRRIGWPLVHACANRLKNRPRRRRRVAAVTAVVFMMSVCLVAALTPELAVSIFRPFRHSDRATDLSGVTHGAVPTAETASSLAVKTRFAILPPANDGTLSVDDPPLDRSIAGGPLLAGKTVETLPETAVSQPPTMLGGLNVKPKDNLTRMITLVYGNFHRRYLDAVLAANPSIANADTIRMGSTITFPAIAAEPVAATGASYWIKLDEAPFLENAFRRIQQLAETDAAPPIRLIIDCEPIKGMTFGIYLAGYFADRESARRQLAGLPADLARHAEIISGWPPRAIFFSDPYADHPVPVTAKQYG
ncbi:AAA family ATPase [Desulfosarcina ovata]|uniref:Phage tail protein n=1 Tax=Desulfosarcina ovata subsp. ovata TaxID=2752305 RepID=A0A5K8A517_9BACT|nr:AAA family ATPase [Desulfosarcina ovata]BBO87390.1 phage tail protein [Desulfosarcina ovata subsp. ovata]